MGASVKPLMLLLDTSVWMDYFLARQRSHNEVAEIVALAQDSETVALCVSSHSLKDIAYLMASAMKAESRREGIDVTSEVGAAARETAWGCVRCIVDSALVVPVGRGEVLQAFTFKALHPDFEDDLLLGAAYCADVDYLVTSDELLARHAPVTCVDPEQALKLVREACGISR